MFDVELGVVFDQEHNSEPARCFERAMYIDTRRQDTRRYYHPRTEALKRYPCRRRSYRYQLRCRPRLKAVPRCTHSKSTYTGTFPKGLGHSALCTSRTGPFPRTPVCLGCRRSRRLTADTLPDIGSRYWAPPRFDLPDFHTSRRLRARPLPKIGNS